jgi:hypothetical protein
MHRYKILNFKNNTLFKIHIRDWNTDKNICDWFWWVTSITCVVNHHSAMSFFCLCYASLWYVKFQPCVILYRVLKKRLQTIRACSAHLSERAMLVLSLQQMFCVVPMHVNTTSSSSSLRSAYSFRNSWFNLECPDRHSILVAVTPLCHRSAVNIPKGSPQPKIKRIKVRRSYRPVDWASK